MNNFFELQPLRLQSGWTIEFNYFTEYDLDIHDKNIAFQYLVEDLLRLSWYQSGTTLIIDLGWYPDGNVGGNYILQMVKDGNWTLPLTEVATKSKEDVIKHIEKWVCHGFFSKYL